MPRKSGAALAVVPVGLIPRLAPPDELTDRQKAIWREIVDSKPAEWFDAASVPLLSAYCKAVTVHETMAAQVEAFESEWLASAEGLERFRILAGVQHKYASLISSLATKMRLAQQSRYDKTSAHSANKRSGSSIKPWERK